MARVMSSVGARCPGNSKLDSFLKRNTERGVYERIRAYEPCVVVSEAVNKVYMHVILSDECVYLAEYPPRTVRPVLRFSQVRDIELVNDLPDFLSGKARELSQHVRVLYSTTKPAGKRGDWSRKGKKVGLPVRSSLPSRRNLQLLVPRGLEDLGAEEEREEVRLPRSAGRSASCPSPDTLGLGGQPGLRRCTVTPSPLTLPLPPPPWPLPSSSSSSLPTSPLKPPGCGATATTQPRQVSRRRHFVLDRLLKRAGAGGGGEGERDAGEREAELHLYAVSRASRIYLHLQNSWNSYIIRSTLMLDPYRRRCSTSSHSAPRKRSSTLSWERTAHLFSQLSGEILQGGLQLERLYLLLQELRTAAQRNVALRKLFWRSSDMCVFLVQTLEDSLHSCQSSESPPTGGHTADQLLLCTLIAQTLAVMFRETEVEPARHSMLTAKRGALTARMLLAVVCDPQLHTHSQDPSLHAELQTLLAEYLDSACSLLFELVLLGQEASRGSSLENFLTVGWLFGVVRSDPHLLPFMGYQAQQVVSALSDPGPPALSPARSVLLFQRCRVLLASLQHSHLLGLYLHSHYCEEFRYCVKPSSAAERLPALYPISQPALGLVHQLLALILHR
ncbi:unnamed protein product [Merluccius merluccius]